MWTVSAWSACTAGRATRSVTCTRAQGGTADDSVCATNTGYTPASNRLCDVFSCQADSDCSGNGVCEKNTGTCLCKPDFQGEACNIATAHCNATTAATNATAAPATTSTLCCASGVVDKKGSCCASGVVDNTGACCGDKASLDRNGQCCSQKLDACGMCGGDGLIIDFVGTCCNGVIDAGGLCCAKPHVVDEFGVCGGNSSTGILVLDIDVVTDVTQGLSDHNSANYAAFEKAYTTVLATIINVPAGQVQLKTIYATSSTGRRLLDVSTAEDALVGGWRKQLRHWMLHSPRHTTAKAVTTLPASAASHLLVQPTTDRRLLASGASSTLVTVQTTAQIRPPYPTDVPFPEVLEVMLGIYSNTPEHGAIGIKELADINKIGLAGNSICEVGEMPNGTTAGVSSDCPLAFHPVPIKGSKFCSGKGTPVAALGTCQCFVGYDGTACESCAEGYALMAGTCQRTYAGFLAEAKALAAAAAAPSPAKHVAGASVTLPVTAAVVGAVALLVALALFTTYHRRRQARRAGSAASDATKAGAQRTGSAGSAMSGLAWAFADPERGSSATSGTSSLTTPGAAGRSGTALLVDGESSPAPSRRGNFKMVLLNSKPLGHIAKWLTANGITEDQVEVQQAPARSSSQTSSEGSLAPSDTSVYQHFKKVYNNFAMETGEIPTPPPATRPEYAMEKMDSIVGKPGYGFQVAASADKSAAARRGSMAFSQGSDDGSDAGLVAAKPARRGLFGFSLGTSEPMAATTAAAARDPSMAFSDASSEGKVPRAMLGSVAFASEEAAAVRQARRASLAFSSASSDDSQTSAGRKQMGSIAFADSAAAKAKAPQLGSFAFSEGEARKGGRAGQMGSFAFSDDDATSKGKTPARLGSFAFSNASSDDERRSAKRHGFNYALDEEGRRAARPSGVAMEALPEGGVQRAESTMSTDTIKSKRSYAYKMDVVEQRKRYATFSTVDASDSSITSASSGDGNLTARPNALFSSFVSTSEASTSSHTSGSVAPSDPSSNGSGRALISSKAPPKKPASWRRDNNIKEDKPLPPPAPSS
ncbi:hypothetical protein WJX72_006446 [[Myrmecia] bisecta]|uniref:EGF-like domain-containing protein n=1 Tax=[Myrmecia] bisecta TaxID=41462 RepID=A0AAW1Q7G5_9CHLO